MSLYEIWLGLNIFWELALANPGVIAAIGGAWLLLAAFVLSRKPLCSACAAWRAAMSRALMLAVAIGAVAFFLIPGATQSSFDAMGYWLDWATVTGLAAASAGIAFAFLLPLLALCHGAAAVSTSRRKS